MTTFTHALAFLLACHDHNNIILENPCKDDILTSKKWVIASQQRKIDAYEGKFWDYVKSKVPGFDYEFKVISSFSEVGKFIEGR